MENLQFGIDLFRQINVVLQADVKNGFISPYSISAALSMTQLGAGGDTARGMVAALRWEKQDKDEKCFHNENKQYISLIQKDDSDFLLSTANRLYIEQRFPVMSDFLQQTALLYLAEAVSAHFSTCSEKECVNINNWVSSQTAHKIQNLLPPGAVNSDTKMVLVNAIYFKGKWSIPFQPLLSRPKSFKVSVSTTKLVPTMYVKDDFNFWMDDGREGFSVLELPYQGDQLSMVILLPSAEFGLADVESKLKGRDLKSVFSRLQISRKIEVFVPSFELTCSYQLRQPLNQMGMQQAFDPLTADFSKISQSPGLIISEVIHKAFIKVNEEGTEAAAATAVVCAPGCAPGYKVDVPCFNVDHPFFFVIRDKRAPNSVLFMGHVVDPALKE